MSMCVDFTPHSWYMGAAICDCRKEACGVDGNWNACLLNGMTGYIVDFEAPTLAQLKRDIKAYVVAEKARIKRLHEATA